MVTYFIVTICFAVLCVTALALVAFRVLNHHEKECAEWKKERSTLLDRIQAGNFNEYKAQERADTPIKRKEKDPIIAKLEGEPWL